MTAVLGLHPGEGRTVGLAMAVSFLASAGIMIAQSAIDALFFARYGVDRLPVMYLLVGVAMFATTFAIGALFSRLGRGRAFLLVFAAIAIAAVAGRAAIETGAGWVYAALWLVYSVAEFIQLLAVWGLAGLIADTRQAKRFFPVIGAGGVCGLILGGGATAPLASALGSENLLLVWALLAAGAAALGLLLVKTRARAALAAPPRRRKRAGGLSSAFGDVRNSQLLRWMSAGALLMSLMFSLLYLPFSEAAVERYPDADDLAGFFGLFFAAGMGTALVLSLLVTGRLLKRFGVPVIILALPVLYFFAFGVLAFAATFATLTLFRFAQVAWVSGGSSSTWEALVNTIPAERRDRVRAFLYGVPKQLGTITAGGVALVAQQLEENRILYAAGVAAAAAAVATMLRIRAAYPRALISALREGRPTIFGSPGDPRPVFLHADSTALFVLEQLLHDHDPGVRRFAAHSLGELEHSRSSWSLVRAAHDDDPEVRATALEALHRAVGRKAVPAAESRASDPDPVVRLAALRVLAECGVSPDLSLLDDRDLAVRALAAALLASSEPGEAVLTELARGADPEGRLAAMRAIAIAPRTELTPVALSALRDSEPRVRAEAAKAVASTAREQAVEPLVAALADPDPRVTPAVAEALEKVGAPAVDRVAEALLDGYVSGALSALERLPLDGARDQVRRFAEESVARALEDHRLRSSLPEDGAAVETLRDSLGARAERRAVEALRAAALLGDRSAVSAALESLHVADANQRANALEVIETVGEPEIVRPLLTLWEPERAHRADPDAILQLRADPDEWIRACAELAGTALEGEPMTHTLPTVPLVERVMFLRKVPLFAGLPPQDLQPIAAAAEEHVFSADDVIAERGEPGDTTYILVEGEVRVIGAEEEEIAARRGPGDVMGEMAVISSRPRVASLVAATDARVLELHKAAFEAILRERPETALAMMRLLCERLVPPEETTQ